MKCCYGDLLAALTSSFLTALTGNGTPAWSNPRWIEMYLLRSLLRSPKDSSPSWATADVSVLTIWQWWGLFGSWFAQSKVLTRLLFLYQRFTLDAVGKRPFNTMLTEASWFILCLLPGTTALGHDFNTIVDNHSPFVAKYNEVMDSIASPLYVNSFLRTFLFSHLKPSQIFGIPKTRNLVPPKARHS